MRSNSIQTFAYAMLGLALIGIADAGYDSYAIYTGQELWCPPPIDGCNIVAASPYARIFGVPLGYLGVVFYLGMAALAALLVSAPMSRTLPAVAAGYATFGLLSSVAFFYIQARYIHAFCIYCLVSAVLTVLLCGASWLRYRASRVAGNGGLQPAG